jgi:AraC-like DNA-binding protein
MLTRLRPAKINFYLKTMARMGFAAERVLEGTGIDRRTLADRHGLVEISRYIRLIANINRLSRSPSLAFDLGEQLQLGDLGILGYSVMSCADTDEATALWLRYTPVFFGNLIEFESRKVGKQLLLSFIPYPDIRADLLQFLIEEKICYDMALQRLIGIPKFPIAHLALTYPAPAHVARYKQLIECPIEFSAPRSSMLLTDYAFAIPLQGSDAETHAHCLNLLNEIYDSASTGASWSHKVRAAIHESQHRPQNIDDVAAQLHCTGRTLNRRLAREGCCFSDLNAATRLETVKNLLATTHLESKEIASRIGFSDVRSLRRFFKTHTGKTIQQFRRETVNGVPD